MTAAERTSSGAGDERVEAVADVLRAHAWNGRDWGCECGTVLYQHEHHAHVAAALAPLLATRPDDGAGERLAAVVDELQPPFALNPRLAPAWRLGVNDAARQIRAALGQGDGGKGSQAGVSGSVSAEQAGDERGDNE